MPVRLLSSSVKKWPSAEEVFEAFRHWANGQTANRRDIKRIGCFGSIVNGKWGVGSDLDIIIVLSECNLLFTYRSKEWDITSLPVDADVVVLTDHEIENHKSRRFREMLEREVRWIVGK